jgi:hypothetical protein
VSTTAVSTSPDPVPAVPDADEVFAFAVCEIAAAAAELWPRADVDLGEHVPSVTGYVRRIRVDGHLLYAKYAFLGVSLVSLLRGACGRWSDVRKAQQAYVQRPGRAAGPGGGAAAAPGPAGLSPGLSRGRTGAGGCCSPSR